MSECAQQTQVSYKIKQRKEIVYGQREREREMDYTMKNQMIQKIINGLNKMYITEKSANLKH